MANLEKHKKNIVLEWLEGEEGAPPAQSGGSHSPAGSSKAPAKARRVMLASAQGIKADPALAREPAPAARLAEKPSQASSPEHLGKKQRLPKLRAPFSPHPPGRT